MHYLYTIISAESDNRLTPLKSLFLYFDHILSLIYHFFKKKSAGMSLLSYIV